MHSAQAIWAGIAKVIARWHTCCSHALGRVAARPAEWLLVTHLLLGHVQVFGSEVDGSTTLRELRRTMHLQHAADGRPRRELSKTSDLTLIVRSQELSDPAHLGVGLDHAYRVLPPSSETLRMSGAGLKVA